ncbi:hypothetical protein NPIL_586631 [Nephila pilipes]|uniref:Uncharacterized protein n=1 Tax=Nephila pilipes TaxID=299642 RepID=A0A8X6JQF1_NEPPI|nr:hypothetical protein NPIL_586631 [Nephila pilipes]
MLLTLRLSGHQKFCIVLREGKWSVSASGELSRRCVRALLFNTPSVDRASPSTMPGRGEGAFRGAHSQSHSQYAEGGQRTREY